ncbi:MAG: hypothetical protein NTV07_02995 [Candidatus Omnitrophica bacterium]|nr:hypothetical protein [Candidatus Omnitrophota bacterium]
MIIVLGIIAALLFALVLILGKFMHNMAIVESELIKEIREMKDHLMKMNKLG